MAAVGFDSGSNGDTGISHAELISLATLFVVAASLCFAVARTGSQPVKRKPPPEPVYVSASWSDVTRGVREYRGSVSAPYTLVVFADYSCPATRHADMVLSAILKSDDATLRIAYRQLPLPMFAKSIPVATAIEAARSLGSFWQFHEFVMRCSGEEVASLNLRATAKKLGIDLASFDKARRGVALIRVQEDKLDAKRLRVFSSPGLFLREPNGTIIRFFAIQQLRRYLSSHMTAIANRP